MGRNKVGDSQSVLHNWDDPSLPYLDRVSKIPYQNKRDLMNKLFDFGYTDFNKNYPLVEKDMSGDMYEILS